MGYGLKESVEKSIFAKIRCGNDNDVVLFFH